MGVVRTMRLPTILAGAALLAGLAMWAGLPAVLHAFATLGYSGFLLVLVIHLPLIVLMGMAWWSIARNAGIASFVEARLVRDAVAELLPFSQIGGFAAGIRLLSLSGVPAQAGATSLLADLMTEFLGKLLYAVAGLALLAWFRPLDRIPSYLWITLGLLAGICFLMLLFRGLLWAFVSRIFSLGLQTVGGGLHGVWSPNRLAPSGLLHAICWALGGVEAWVTLRLMDLPVTMPEALAIDSLATSLRTFGFWMPAALGVQEAAYVLAAGLFGLLPHIAIAFSLVRRARDLVVGLIGIASGKAWK